MARGAPDYGNTEYSVALPEAGNDDIVMALSGFSPLDTRGRQFIFDTFRYGLAAWECYGLSGGAVPVLDSTSGRVFVSPFSVKLSPLVNQGQSYLTRNFYMPVTGRISLECAFWSLSSSGDFKAEIIYAKSAGKVIRCGFIYSPKTGEFRITTAIGYVVFSDFAMPAATGLYWLHMKVVVDLDTEQYVRLLIGNQQFEISYAANMAFVPVTVGVNIIQIICSAPSALYVGDCHLGYVVISYDEP